MDNNDFVKIPTEIVLGNKTFEENKKYVKIIINNRYNFINKNNEFISDMWFSKIDGDFVNGEVIVTKKGGKYNVLKEDGALLFDEWMYYINRIDNEDENKDFNSYKICRSKDVVNIYDSKNGFITDEDMLSYGVIGLGMYILTDKKTNFYLYDSINGNVIHKDNINFRSIDTFGKKLFIVEKYIDKKWTYNLMNRNGVLLFENWVEESPKMNWDNNNENNIIIYGDMNTGYSLIDENGNILSDEIYSNILYKPDGIRGFKFICGLVCGVSSNNNIISFDENGKKVDVENSNSNELLNRLLLKAISS